MNHASLPADPVAFPFLVVRNCWHSHHVFNGTVEQAVWIAVEDVSAVPALKNGQRWGASETYSMVCLSSARNHPPLSDFVRGTRHKLL